MNKTKQLLGKPLIKNIGGVDWEIHPLGIEELELVSKLDDPKTVVGAMKELVIKTILAADPETNKEEANKVSIKYFKAFRDALEEVNGLSDGNTKQDTKAEIEQ